MKLFDYLTHIIFTKSVDFSKDSAIDTDSKIYGSSIAEVDDSPDCPRIWIPVQNVKNPDVVFKDYCCIYDLNILQSSEALGKWEWDRSSKKIVDYRIFYGGDTE